MTTLIVFSRSRLVLPYDQIVKKFDDLFFLPDGHRHLSLGLNPVDDKLAIYWLPKGQEPRILPPMPHVYQTVGKIRGIRIKGHPLDWVSEYSQVVGKKTVR